MTNCLTKNDLSISLIDIDCDDENSNDRDPKLKVGHHARSSKYNIFAKDYSPNLSKFFGIKKVINTVPWAYIIEGLNCKEIVGTFYKKQLQKTNETEFRIEKVIKKKMINLVLTEKVVTTSLIVKFKKKIQNSYYPVPDSHILVETK